LLQAVIPASYPILKQNFNLNFTQIGLITLAYQLAASILQPLVGLYTDKRPKPFSQIFGMLFTLAGIVSLSYASSFGMIIAAVIWLALVPLFFIQKRREFLFWPQGKRGLAQSIFQLGGNAGTAIGPLLVALIVVPNTQFYIIWFAIVALIGLLVLSRIALWYQSHLNLRITKKTVIDLPNLSQKTIVISVVILMILIFSKFFYMASMSSYFTFI
jgi:FSR family fosmidomycin resistance protein-like MFS transporter